MDGSGNLSANQTLASEPPACGRRVPGSGRRKGTPNRVNRQVKELAGKYTQRAVKKLWHLAENAKSEETQLRAVVELLAYGHGRPSQAVNLGGGEKPIGIARADLTDAEPKELARRAEMLIGQLGITEIITKAFDAEPRPPLNTGNGFVPLPKQDYTDVSQRPTEPVAEPFEPLEGIQDLQRRDLLPRRGESLWLNDIELRGLPGRGNADRPMALYAGGRLIASGGWVGLKGQLERLFKDREIPEPSYGPINPHGVSEPPPQGSLRRWFERLTGGTR